MSPGWGGTGPQLNTRGNAKGIPAPAGQQGWLKGMGADGWTDRQAALSSQSPRGDTQWVEMLEVAEHHLPASLSPHQRWELPKRHCHLVAQRPARLRTVRHHTSYITHHTFHVIHLASYISHHTSHIIHFTSYIARHTPHVIHLTSHRAHPWTIHTLQRCTQTLLAGELPPGESVPKR